MWDPRCWYYSDLLPCVIAKLQGGLLQYTKLHWYSCQRVLQPSTLSAGSRTIAVPFQCEIRTRHLHWEPSFQFAGQLSLRGEMRHSWIGKTCFASVAEHGSHGISNLKSMVRREHVVGKSTFHTHPTEMLVRLCSNRSGGRNWARADEHVDVDYNARPPISVFVRHANMAFNGSRGGVLCVQTHSTECSQNTENEGRWWRASPAFCPTSHTATNHYREAGMRGGGTEELH